MPSHPSPWRSRWRCSSSTRVRDGPSAVKRTSISLVFEGSVSSVHCRLMSQLDDEALGRVEGEHARPAALAAVDAAVEDVAAHARLEDHLGELALEDVV